MRDKNVDINQLKLAKYVFKKGEELLFRHDPFGPDLAISLFQDSIELLLWAIAKYVDADIEDTEPFQNYWKKINEKLDKNEKLSNKAKMLEINKARVNFKHKGIRVHDSEAVKYREYTETFLLDSMKKIFNIDYDLITFAEFLYHEEIKDKIIDAEKYYNNGDYSNCINKCAEAEVCINEIIDAHIFQSPKAIRNVYSDFFEDAFRSNQKQYAFVKFTREAFMEIQRMINTMRLTLIPAILHVNLWEFDIFKDLTPAIRKNEKGDFEIISAIRSYNEEQARFCLQFINKYALALQEASSFKYKDSIFL
jgi:hypothetical protein